VKCHQQISKKNHYIDRARSIYLVLKYWPVNIRKYWPAVLTKTNREHKNVKYNILDYTMNLAKFQILLLIINIITIMNLKNCTLKDKKTKFANGLFYVLRLKGQLKEKEKTNYLFQLETNRQEHYLIKRNRKYGSKIINKYRGHFIWSKNKYEKLYQCTQVKPIPMEFNVSLLTQVRVN
jgi:hypothetical protein